jgi:hypothetical protein
MGIFDIFTGNASKKALNQQIATQNAGKKEAYGFLDTGLNNATGLYGQAGGMFDPYAQGGLKGQNLYSDALGINGAQGNQNAVNAFQTSPGYQFGMDQGIQALERRASAQGNLQSGNTNLDTLKYAQGYANNNYNDWLSRLQGVGAQGLQATGSQAGLLSDLGNQNINVTGAKANAATGVANNISNAYGNYAAAQNNASGNIWGALLGLGNLGVSAKKAGMF